MRKNFLPVRKSPFTNTAKWNLFCMRKVNISLFLMKSLQDWGLLGEIYIGCGFIRGKLAGIYYDILGRVCGRLAAGVALCKALGARLPGGGIVCSRLSASRSHRRVKACTARRRGVPFVRTRRRGLCSMSGRYPYGIDNPPTLRRSSFPRRALRPAGGPMPKHAWGCAPRPPNA